MRKVLVVGNWKMNGSPESVDSLVKALVALKCEADVVVCPPAVYLMRVGHLLEGSAIALGAQNLDWHESGAFTGEVSAGMLRELACEYSIIGHSERRMLYAETNDQVVLKFEACLREGIKPILCLGETLAQRAAGETEIHIESQLNFVLDKINVERFAGAVIAYEPIWAIGTGETASPEQAEAVHSLIRRVLAERNADLARDMQILYGGSVNEKNAAELFAMKNIDGALVGGASLIAESFASICHCANDTQAA